MMERLDGFKYYHAACRRFCIPDATREALCQYFVRGQPVGAFLEALLANDFVGAACHAETKMGSCWQTTAGSWPTCHRKMPGAPVCCVTEITSSLRASTGDRSQRGSF